MAAFPARVRKNRLPNAASAFCARTGSGPTVRIGIGVDRLDYTKGILERFAAIERLLEIDTRWIGRFAFIEIAAPSRSSIEEYQELDARVRAAAQRVNDRFGTPDCRPIILKIEHHDADEVYAHYRAADVCFVSSLHDGMNLVAKEYVAAREDERGALILSQFTGAAGELPEALIVNPYDTEQCATALRVALDMPPDEQRERMRSMRNLDSGVQRPPLGRPHAARRGAHASPAQARGGRAAGSEGDRPATGVARAFRSRLACRISASVALHCDLRALPLVPSG